LIAAYALSRLQNAAHYYEWQWQQEENINNNIIIDNEPELIQELAHSAIYANVAYGWKMELAFWQRLHFQALLRRTGVSKEDVIMVEWESKTHQPAYFYVRDRKR
jgi:hypothetical protein